jgi:hypothetical protein
LPRKSIGQQHRRAKVAADALVAAFPLEWHDIRNFVDDRPETAVPERCSLLALVRIIPVEGYRSANVPCYSGARST